MFDILPLNEEKGATPKLKHIEIFDLNRYPFYSVFRRTTTVQDDYQETFHAHQGIEFQYIHEGEGQLIIDQKTAPIYAGTLCVFQPFQLHRLQMKMNDQTRYVRSFMLFEPSVMDTYLSGLPILNQFFHSLCRDKLTAPVHYSIDEDHDLVRLFASCGTTRIAFGEQERQEHAGIMIIAFLRILRTLIENDQHCSHPQPRSIHRTEEIMAWIERHYAEPFRLEKLAGDLHMSPYYLSHLFQATTGTSISEYVKACRIRKAVVLLTLSDQSVSEIGEAVGFHHTSYFCKIFRQEKGLTPHQYRLQWKKRHV